jgi:hypothetical protein
MAKFDISFPSAKALLNSTRDNFLNNFETFKIEMDSKLANGEITQDEYNEIFETPEMARKRRALFTNAFLQYTN